MATKTTKAETASGSMLKITLKAGLVGKMDKHIRVVRALGLRKFNSSVVHADSPTIRGMVRKIVHMVEVSPATVGDAAKKKSVAQK